MGGALFWGGFQGVGDCCCMILLDALGGCSKTYKIVFFDTLLLDAEETENHETNKKTLKSTPIFGGALKTGRK